MISRHFILKSIIRRLSSWKTIIPRISCIKSLLNKLYTPKVIVQDEPKRNVFVKFPFLGSTLFQKQKKLQKLFNDKLTSCNLKILLTSPVRVKSFFTFKDKLPKILWLIYKYKCGGCSATYHGKTKRHFKVRIREHLGISHLPRKKLKIDNNKLTAIQEHLLCCNYYPSYENFSILTRENYDFKLKIMERLLIARDKPYLNKAGSSLPLRVFWYNINSYHMMLYHIIWCPYITLCVCNCRLFSF